MKENNEMKKCRDCFWGFEQVNLHHVSSDADDESKWKLIRKKEFRCSLHDLIKECPDHVRNVKHSQLLKRVKENNDVKERARCCILTKCRPTRNLLSRLRECEGFMKYLRKEKKEGLDELLRGMEDMIKVLETSSYKKRGDYLQPHIELAVALYVSALNIYGSQRNPFTQSFVARLFHTTAQSVRQYKKRYLK